MISYRSWKYKERQARKLKMSDVLCHHLAALPWALASAKGSLRKHQKPQQHTLFHGPARIIVGVNGPQHKRRPETVYWSDVDGFAWRHGHPAYWRGLRRFQPDHSIKTSEREGLKKGSWIRKHQGRQQDTQWRKFLSNSRNKLFLWSDEREELRSTQEEPDTRVFFMQHIPSQPQDIEL